MWTTLEIGGDKKAENDQILRFNDHYWWKGLKDHVHCTPSEVYGLDHFLND